ncbi:MAG: hypothetical protein JWO36_2650 [Myxococcales bacterium]|nr:hypothetical protein [Myxococcales bacterium]
MSCQQYRRRHATLHGPLALAGALCLVACGRVSFDTVNDGNECQPCATGEACGPTLTCVPAVAATGGLIGYWPLDEAAGATEFRDLSGNGNTGSCATCPTAGVPGMRGTAVEFANVGLGDAIGVGTGPSLTTLSSQLTVSGWVKLRAYSSYDYIVSNDRDCCGTYNGFSLWAAQYGDEPGLQLWNGTATADLVKGTSRLPLAEWHLVTSSYDGTEMRIYVDGALVGTSARIGGFSTPPSFETRIGAMGYDRIYGIKGVIDEVMIFSRALTSAEIATLYHYYTGS